MRFRFCGDLDCPDWVLLEISILSQLNTAKVEVITKQIFASCLHHAFSEEEVLKVAEQNEDGVSDLKGVVAAIHFMIINAAKYDVDEASLSQEIQQLGLPKANADLITIAYRHNKDVSNPKTILLFALYSFLFKTVRLFGNDLRWKVTEYRR